MHKARVLLWLHIGRFVHIYNGASWNVYLFIILRYFISLLLMCCKQRPATSNRDVLPNEHMLNYSFQCKNNILTLIIDHQKVLMRFLFWQRIIVITSVDVAVHVGVVAVFNARMPLEKVIRFFLFKKFRKKYFVPSLENAHTKTLVSNTRCIKNYLRRNVFFFCLTNKS